MKNNCINRNLLSATMKPINGTYVCYNEARKNIFLRSVSLILRVPLLWKDLAIAVDDFPVKLRRRLEGSLKCGVINMHNTKPLR